MARPHSRDFGAPRSAGARAASGIDGGVDVASLLLAPVRVPLRVGRALDDLAALADRARRDPDPVAEVSDRIDALLAELATLNALAAELLPTAVALDATAREIVDGGAELTAEARALRQVAREIRDGGTELTHEARALRGVSIEIRDGGERLTEVSQALELHLRTFHAALPRLLQGLDTVEELEEAVETVADTVEPLQGAAARVGRVTQRFSRSA